MCVGISVMVFIHGQSYSYGSAGLYDARVLSALADIVVVTFNYRLGLLGNRFFFATSYNKVT